MNKLVGIVFGGLLLLTMAQSLAAEGGSALFWQVERDGETVGYLLGTIHSEDPRVVDFSPEFLEMLQSNDVFAMEMVPDLPTLTRMMEYMHYQDGTLLEQLVGAGRYQQILKALAGYRMPESQIVNLKLWAAMLTLSVPPPTSGLFMDFSLSLRASGSGMRVVGLESLEEQLSFLESMPHDQQLEMLDDALESYDKVGEIHREMVEMYLKNDLELLSEQSQLDMKNLDPAIRDFFEREGIVNRNQRMAERLVEHLGQSSVFAAVGALHLPGESGLIQLLRAAGYRLSPLPLPFIQEVNSASSSNKTASAKKA